MPEKNARFFFFDVVIVVTRLSVGEFFHIFFFFLVFPDYWVGEVSNFVRFLSDFCVDVCVKVSFFGGSRCSSE